MRNDVFTKLKLFASKNNLEITTIIERRIDDMIILKFTNIITGKSTNIVINIYDQLNISDGELYKEITEQVERRLLKNK